MRVRGEAPVATFGSGDDWRGIVWVLRTAPLNRAGMIDSAAPPIDVEVEILWRPEPKATAVAWDTATGGAEDDAAQIVESGQRIVLRIRALRPDRAIALGRRIP